MRQGDALRRLCCGWSRLERLKVGLVAHVTFVVHAKLQHIESTTGAMYDTGPSEEATRLARSLLVASDAVVGC